MPLFAIEKSCLAAGGRPDSEVNELAVISAMPDFEMG
jgi:hypothetical protein